MKVKKNFRIAILASGNGTNAEAIIRYFLHHPQIETVLVLSNNENAYVLKRAQKYGIPTHTFSKQQFSSESSIVSQLQGYHVTHLVLAGFLLLIPPVLIHAFPDKIINIHPALLPLFGGKGMYGNRVHEAVKASGRTETGITIHLVNEHYDEGRVLFQASCPVNPDDTPEKIADAVHELEYANYAPVIEKWITESA